MRNKTWKYLVVTSAIFVLSACGGGTKKQVNEDVSMDSVNGVCDGLKTLQLDEVKVTWIQDNAKERLMERTLFADADDSLIESLKLTRRNTFVHECFSGGNGWNPNPVRYGHGSTG